MLIREGPARQIAHDRRLACALALVAGGLNSAGFYSAGVFSANMTGNVSALAGHLALGDLLTGAFYLAVVAVFVLGAALATFLIMLGKRRALDRVYVVAILAEAMSLTILGTADVFLPGGSRGTVLVLGLAFAMGGQNAIVTLISDARIRSTHVSGIATDIGIELGRLVEIAARRAGVAETRTHRDRIGLHGVTIAAFCTGGVLGIVAFKAWGAGLLFGAAGLLATLALPAYLPARKPASVARP